MKKLFLLLGFLFTCFFLFAQHPVGNDSLILQTLGSNKTLIKSKHSIGSDSGFVNARYPDTAAANMGKIAHYPGAQIIVGNIVYLRNNLATGWIPIGIGVGGGCDTCLIKVFAFDSLTVKAVRKQGDTIPAFVLILDSSWYRYGILNWVKYGDTASMLDPYKFHEIITYQKTLINQGVTPLSQYNQIDAGGFEQDYRNAIIWYLEGMNPDSSKAIMVLNASNADSPLVRLQAQNIGGAISSKLEINKHWPKITKNAGTGKNIVTSINDTAFADENGNVNVNLGSGGTTTASHGLTMFVNDVHLGGALQSNAYIDATASGAGVLIQSTGGVPLGLISDTIPLSVWLQDTFPSPSANTKDILLLRRSQADVTGPLVNSGTAIAFDAATSSGGDIGSNESYMNRIISTITNALYSTRSSKLEIEGVRSGTRSIWVKFDGQYGYLGLDTIATRAYARSAGGGSSGETNTASNLGGGLANYDSKSGVDLRFNSFNASDFNLSSNLISLDYVNGQAATSGQNGFLASGDWTTFNNKIGVSSPTNGDILYYNSGWQKLAIGTSKQKLSVVGGLPAWRDSTASAASVNIYNSDGTLTGARILNQNGNRLKFQSGGQDLLDINPAIATSVLRQYDAGTGMNADITMSVNPTGSDFVGSILMRIDPLVGPLPSLLLSGDAGNDIYKFNLSTGAISGDSSSITGTRLGAGGNEIIYKSGTHTINGGIKYNSPVSGASTDSVITWNATTKSLNMRNVASFGTVTNVTGTAPVIITGTSTVTPNVTVDTSKAIGRLATFSDVAKKWDITGNAGVNSPDTSSTWIGTTNNTPFRFKTNGTGRMIIDSAGKIGIGTKTPQQGLDVETIMRIGGNTTGYMDIFQNGATILDFDPVTTDASTGYALRFFRHTNTSGIASLDILQATGTASTASNRISANSNGWVNYNAGNFGIGTPAPAYKLEVTYDPAPSTARTATSRLTNFTNNATTFNTTSGAMSSYVGYFNSNSTRTSGSNALTNIGLYSSASGAQNNYAAIFELGSVGIGTTAPDSTFQVNGGLKFVTGRQGAGKILTSDANGGADWQTSSAGAGTVTNIATGLGLSGGPITTTGTLLVDTSSASILSRQRAASTYLPLAGGTMTGNILATDNTYDLGATGATRFRTAYLGTSLVAPLIIGGSSTTQTLTYQTTSGVGASGADHIFKVGNNGATEAMRIINAGNVGIGMTPNAGVKLDITYAGDAIRAQVTGSGSLGLSLSNADGRAASFFGKANGTNGVVYINAISGNAGDIFQINKNNVITTRVDQNGNLAVNTSAGPTSTLQSGGSFATGYVAKTATYTATISDYTIECTANTFTVTLPTAVGITGRIYNVVNSGAGTITIGTTSSQTFVNVVATPTTLTLAAVGSVMVQSNGANWMQLK